jgi:hypothetical protein
VTIYRGLQISGPKYIKGLEAVVFRHIYRPVRQDENPPKDDKRAVKVVFRGAALVRLLCIGAKECSDY